MTVLDCERVRDLLPEFVGERLALAEEATVHAHIQSCAECQIELELARVVAAARLNLPAGLHSRVVAAVGTGRSPAWSGRMTLAASIAVAIIGGSVLLSERPAIPDISVPLGPQPVPAAESGAGWLSVEDAFVSGAASLRDLSEDELKTLLAELGS